MLTSNAVEEGRAGGEEVFVGVAEKREGGGGGSGGVFGFRQRVESEDLGIRVAVACVRGRVLGRGGVVVCGGRIEKVCAGECNDVGVGPPDDGKR